MTMAPTRLLTTRLPLSMDMPYISSDYRGKENERSLLLDDPNKERELINHIMTPGSKVWGYTDDIEEDAYISFQYMESWLSYTDDIADDAYIALQCMEEWNKKDEKEKSLARTPRCFKRLKAAGKFLRLRNYQLPRPSLPNRRVPRAETSSSLQQPVRSSLPGTGWPRSLWYQMKL